MPHKQAPRLFHVYNRGTDKRDIFLDDTDRNRFCENLFEFNDFSPASHHLYKSPFSEVQPRKKVVEILSYCLMSNHYHLLVQEAEDTGLATFMQKLGTGYTMYFNTKHQRSGSLFQGRYKAIRLKHNAHLFHLPHYIHANPLGDNVQAGISRIAAYRWSSGKAYLTDSQNPIIDKKFLSSLYANGYRNAFSEWLKSRKDRPPEGVKFFG